MTTANNTTAAQAPCVTRKTIALVAPDLAANVAAAQYGGDLVYETMQALDKTPAECADAYHKSFVAIMLIRGTPMPCCCAHCARRPRRKA